MEEEEAEVEVECEDDEGDAQLEEEEDDELGVLEEVMLAGDDDGARDRRAMGYHTAHHHSAGRKPRSLIFMKDEAVMRSTGRRLVTDRDGRFRVVQ